MHHRKLLAAALLGAASPSLAKIAARSETPSLYHEPSGEGTTLVDDTYIVLFNKDHNLSDHYINTGVNVSDISTEFRHFRNINGYSAVIHNKTLVHELRHDPGVKVVQRDSLHFTNHTFEQTPGDFQFSDYAAGGSKHASQHQKPRNMGHNGAKYSSSNYGDAVDIWAPGESVECADQNGNPTRMTGTSFSAPWVVGLAAVIISEEWAIIGTNVDSVWERITQNSIANGLQGLPTGMVMQTGVNHKDRQANRPYAYFGGSLVYGGGDPMDVDDIPDGGEDEIL